MKCVNSVLNLKQLHRYAFLQLKKDQLAVSVCLSKQKFKM